MTDEQINALLTAAENRASLLHASDAWGSDEDGHIMNRLVDVIEAQAAEIERLREALDWAIAEIDGRTIYPGSDQFTIEQQFENALEAARAALAQETQP
jgi:hypothetical protein